jgi:hypothetical protein
MQDNLVESTDSAGRTVVEMNDHELGLLSIGALICAAPVFALGFDRKVLPWAVLGYVVFVALYFLSRKHLRLVIDPRRRRLTVGRRSIPLDQIRHAELAAMVGAKSSGPGGAKPVFYRVEIVLRSGERVPTISGFGQFNEEDCHRLMDLINAAADLR